MPTKMSRYAARYAAAESDLEAVQALRHKCFRANNDGRLPGDASRALDADDFDVICRHILIEDKATKDLIACCRLMYFESGADIDASYAAQYYDLTGLRDYENPMVEIGRFCMSPDCRDPDALRMAWAAVTQFVDDHGVEMLFGCSSFLGTQGEDFADAFALLADRHIAPNRWRPSIKAPLVFKFAEALRQFKFDRLRGMSGMPPLLRSYLQMGAWVSDHAVVDKDLGTLHVFTGVEISRIPEARKRSLRSMNF